jgi:hypothetical protein
MFPAHALASCILLPLCVAVSSARAAAPDAATLTAQFAAMDDTGWTGADASWSVALPDGRIAWLFGDTFIGGVDDQRCRDRRAPQVHNSLVVQNTDGSMQTVVGGTADAPEALVPGNGPLDWYWPGPPIIAEGALQVPMAHIIRTGRRDWDFKAIGTALAAFDLDDLHLRSIRSLTTPPEVNMASAAVTTRRFTFIYGTRDYPDGHKDAYVARVRAGRLSDPWTFWNGTAWTPDPVGAAPVARGVSNQFSVIRTTTGWRLVTQVPMQRQIVALVGRNAGGPWTSEGVIAEVPEIPNAFTYNATIHREFSANGWWILGFNVNGRDMEHVWGDADLYKPRFLQIQIP